VSVFIEVEGAAHYLPAYAVASLEQMIGRLAMTKVAAILTIV